jgi:putative transposase
MRRLKKSFGGHGFWARRYDVSTMGLDVGKIRPYIRNQETSELIEDGYDTELRDPF